MQLTQRGDRPGGFDLTTDEAAELHVSLKVIRQGCNSTSQATFGLVRHRSCRSPHLLLIQA